ncbi:MAG: hypothetical protein A2W07_01560 [candidate division Zixibacteria bacterium RBG_16_43_9]|nr:MAG: hypothetical protein A2W07_01560 [candidate division Zixibacteria bacterium RBG_16_43_9]
MKSVKILLVCLVAIFVISTLAYAEVPKMINYQGKITTPQGALISDTFSMVFSIYADSTGGTPLWTETQTAVKVEYGVFSILLGSLISIPDSVFNGNTRYLGVKVGIDSEMTPRKAIVSVGYAYHSGTADTAYFAMPDADWTIDGDNIYRLNFNVGIGTPSPQAPLHIRVSGTTLTGEATPTNEGPVFQNSASGNTSAVDIIGPNTGGSVLCFGDTDDRDVAGISYSHLDNSMGFQTNDVYQMRITNNGNVGIGTDSPTYKLDVEGYVQAYGYYTGDIVFQKDKEKLWRMFEDEEGLYLENLKTGKIYRFVLQEGEKK